MNNNEIKIKKLFYVLRPLLAAKWCLERNTIAPMTIDPLMLLMPPSLQQQTMDIIKQKLTAPEGYLIKINTELRKYIDSEYETCMQASAQWPKCDFELAPLNDFFRNVIR